MVARAKSRRCMCGSHGPLGPDGAAPWREYGSCVTGARGDRGMGWIVARVCVSLALGVVRFAINRAVGAAVFVVAVGCVGETMSRVA